MQDGLWIIRVIDLRTHTQDVSTFFNIVLNIVVIALVRQLRKFDLLTSKLFIKVI